MSEIAAIMARLRPRQLAALCTNALAALDENGRVHSPVFASALNGVLVRFDARELAFGSLLQTLKGPALIVHLPDLALRSLAFATGDTTLSEVLGEPDPWGTLYQRVHPELSAATTDFQRAEARELVLGYIFGRGLESSKEWFGSMHLPRTVELYEAWFKSLAGWRDWLNQIDSATADVQMRYQSSYSYPNLKRSHEQKQRLLRENSLVTSRAVVLSIAETLENWAQPSTSAEPPGRSRPRKVDAQQGPQLVAAIGDCYVIECPTETAAELGPAIKENLESLFTENFPGFTLLAEIKTL